MTHKPCNAFTLILAAAAPLWMVGCAQITVTADTIVDGTARIADATTNAVEGTSNFTTDTTRRADAQTHQARLDFVRSRFQAIRREAASGEGENLKALAYMMEAEDRATFSRMMQTHYAELFAAEPDADLLLQRLYRVAGTPTDMPRG